MPCWFLCGNLRDRRDLGLSAAPKQIRGVSKMMFTPARMLIGGTQAEVKYGRGFLSQKNIIFLVGVPCRWRYKIYIHVSLFCFLSYT